MPLFPSKIERSPRRLLLLEPAPRTPWQRQSRGLCGGGGKIGVGDDVLDPGFAYGASVTDYRGLDEAVR